MTGAKIGTIFGTSKFFLLKSYKMLNLFINKDFLCGFKDSLYDIAVLYIKTAYHLRGSNLIPENTEG